MSWVSAWEKLPAQRSLRDSACPRLTGVRLPRGAGGSAAAVGTRRPHLSQAPGRANPASGRVDGSEADAQAPRRGSALGEPGCPGPRRPAPRRPHTTAERPAASRPGLTQGRPCVGDPCVLSPATPHVCHCGSLHVQLLLPLAFLRLRHVERGCTDPPAPQQWSEEVKQSTEVTRADEKWPGTLIWCLA